MKKRNDDVEYYHSAMTFKKFRQSLKLSQRDLGTALECHPQQVSNIERGVCPPPVWLVQKLLSLFPTRKFPRKEFVRSYLMDKKVQWEEEFKAYD